VERDANSPATYKGYDICLGTTNDGLLNWGVYYFLHILPPSIKKATTSGRPFPFTLRYGEGVTVFREVGLASYFIWSNAQTPLEFCRNEICLPEGG